mmetsp:Transcript_88164/g.254430  ORF Transcript_88164/g.254430 Transcript_88164/m.254430 type:complete len:232 (+) Transcript_88164:2200-2895(+)
MGNGSKRLGTCCSGAASAAGRAGTLEDHQPPEDLRLPDEAAERRRNLGEGLPWPRCRATRQPQQPDDLRRDPSARHARRRATGTKNGRLPAASAIDDLLSAVNGKHLRQCGRGAGRDEVRKRGQGISRRRPRLRRRHRRPGSPELLGVRQIATTEARACCGRISRPKGTWRIGKALLLRLRRCQGMGWPQRRAQQRHRTCCVEAPHCCVGGNLSDQVRKAPRLRMGGEGKD